jgi:cytochrome b subunit of formate dehydrogenase
MQRNSTLASPKFSGTGIEFLKAFDVIMTVLTQTPAMKQAAPTLKIILVSLAILFGSRPTIAQSNADCLACHSEPSLSMEKRGKTVSLFVDPASYGKSMHADMECLSCHEGFKADEIPHARRIVPVNCANCHDAEHTAFATSIHTTTKAKKGVTCVDCHSPHIGAKLPENGPARKQVTSHQCASCHARVQAGFVESGHGQALAEGIGGVPGCTDCHGAHDVHPALAEDSKTSRKNEAALCLSCHLNDPDVRARVGPTAGFISSYETSVHGRAIKDGMEGAATCTDCHGSHEMKKGSDQASKVSKKHIAATCGGCHGDVQEQFEGSIHGKALAKGIAASPTCTDCHGEHGILSPKDVRSPVSPKNVSAQVCSPCHASVKLTQKYGLATNRFQSFNDSYHGLANRAGSVEVANCASCHGVHDIKPSTDPTSRIYPANLVKTCGTCHPGANENFTKGAVHVIASSGDDATLYFIATTYVVLIVVTIGGMFVHNVLDFVKKARRQLMYRRGLLQRRHVGHRLYVRMSLGERVQHAVLAVSFMLLVLTGFALRFPDAWWVVWLRGLSSWMFEARGIIHRIAGVLLVLVSLYHVYYVFVVPRGKQLLRDMLPVRQDIVDLLNAFRYYLGFTDTKPQFGRFSYIEKAEYWALIWGTFVMAVTGFILWFDNTFMGLLTKLGWDIARTIHYYEAWLATLAILVWHFYFVIFNPDSYPLNLAFWKGTLTEEEMREEHPLELDEILRHEAALKLADEEKDQENEIADEVDR